MPSYSYARPFFTCSKKTRLPEHVQKQPGSYNLFFNYANSISTSLQTVAKRPLFRYSIIELLRLRDKAWSCLSELTKKRLRVYNLFRPCQHVHRMTYQKPYQSNSFYTKPKEKNILYEAKLRNCKYLIVENVDPKKIEKNEQNVKHNVQNRFIPKQRMDTYYGVSPMLLKC